MASDHTSSSPEGRRHVETADLIKLLCRGLSRLAVAAQGIDGQLDDQLSRLRRLLRSDLSPLELAAVIDAIDDRIKQVDEEREQRIEALQQALELLAGQLLALKPQRPLARELKIFLKELGPELSNGEELALLARLSSLQGQVLAGEPRGAGLFSRWFGGEQRGEVAAAVQVEPRAAETSAGAALAAEAAVAAPVIAASVPVPAAPVELSAAPEPAVPEPAESVPVSSAPEVPASTAPMPVAAASTAPAQVFTPAAPTPVASVDEPPFSRISASVCAVLSGLLRQIEPPPGVVENHQHAREQIDGGLNWYELVSVLEEISLVVLAAQDRDRAAFQQFLLELNQRLVEAHQALDTSLEASAERREADLALGTAVRDQVAAIQAQVSVAVELEQLKTEVSTRLSSIVSAMDHHQLEESSRQQALEQQLTLLTERVRDMEAQSAQVEARFEEQRRLALIDMLTQMPNRQAYEERLQQEYQRWQRYQRPLALVICDVDNFKSINDNYGHSAGDKVLRILAKTLRTRLRQTDFVARFGGEEFVALMPETSVEEALQTLDSIRAAIAECPFHFRSQPVSITLSAGIACFTAGDDTDAVFERADAALYRAKETGRNRCVVDAPMPG